MSSVTDLPAGSTALKAQGKSGFSLKPSRLWGFLLAVAVGVAAMGLGKVWPLIGGPVFAIVLGMVLRNSMGVATVFQPGLRFSSKVLLQWSIIGLGFGLSLPQVMRTGMDSLAVTLVTLTVAFVTALVLGRALGIPSKLRTLIGVGTAICGGSAIAAVTPILKPEEHETALAISTIFIFNIVAVLIFPVAGHMMNMSDAGFGVWAGTAINDTSSVVAAGYSYSRQAGDHATIVKLTRATLIIPICLILAGLEVWRSRQAGRDFDLMRAFPWFIVWFMVASALRSLGWVPVEWLEPLRFLAEFLMVLALAAIGLSSDLRVMARAGVRPALLGLGVWIAVAVSSLLVQRWIGVW
ncbi:YeiH family protein [Alcaligenes faecalis]|uniref:YeiH family protein n=1 Tax=Alcaligenes faecalis TaxID=511 RepID=UPI001C83C4F0|nr:YeiH family protein [Alcaligenes faecalis]MBX6966144.1 YeiH family putative sulfate export transporter [Providencia rettgeri]MBX7032704.1 YeiH family putative sulfate export transporter [Alcaligenes faecalis]